MSILEVHDVSIRYMTGDFKDIGLKEYVMRKLKGEYHVNEFWADWHISFSLEKGDMLGIIGTNGAGKSTLLKAVSGIMEPTGGYVKREGNIAALLELASGFDGDLTVRENTYLRGAMLGYTRKFMDEKYEEIIAFAELQDFQDRPFKQLSSGMKSRLAFSIASLVQPDILILDEVLSVGDGAFRKKSEAKMREIIQGGATTILVSHSIQQVREMCNKVLWLDHGVQIAFSDDVEGICEKYQQFLDGNLVLDEATSPKVSSLGEKKPEDIEHNNQKCGVQTPTPIALKGMLPLTVLILAGIFIMFFMSFPRLDDLTWGSSIGIQRLNTLFAGYNGRYVGNIIVIILTRLPSTVRAGVELAIFCMLFYYAHRLLPKKQAFCFFVIGLLLLPLPVYAQSVVWTAGFANYVPSAVVMLFAMSTYCEVVLREKQLSKAEYFSFAIVIFLGQLILENTSLLMVVMSGAFLMMGLIQSRKLYAPTLIGLISSICGALLMFSNSSYHSALIGDGGNYKSIALIPLALWKKYQNEVVPHLVQNNHLLNLLLAIILFTLWLCQSLSAKKASSNKYRDRLGKIWGILLITFFGYDAVDSTWTKIFIHGQTIYALISLLYAAYIISTICVTIANKEDKIILLVFSGAQIILAAPLVPVAPLNARCFFQNGILWALILGYLLHTIFETYLTFSKAEFFEREIAIFTQIICIVYLIFTLCGQAQSWHVQQLRIEETQNQVAYGAEEIVLPEVPWSSIYCYGANISNTNSYWLTNYKRYYGIPDNIKLSFMDYYKWLEQYRNQ